MLLLSSLLINSTLEPQLSSTEEWLQVSLSNFHFEDNLIDKNQTKPEFAWLIQSEGKVIYRLANAEGIIYVPLDVSIKPRLILAEVDAEKDQILEEFDLNFTNKKIVFKEKKGNVFVTVNRIYPNSSSGLDSNPEKAKILQSPKSDSVNFIENDVLDYYKIDVHLPCILVIARDPVITESLLGDAKIFPNKEKGYFSIIATEQPDFLRIRAVPGSRRSRYFLYPLPKNSCEEESLDLSYKFVLTEKIFLNHNFLNHWSNLFLEIKGSAEINFCLKKSSKSIEHEAFCGYVIYNNPKPEIRRYYRAFIQSRSKKVKKILRKLDFK